MSDRFKFTAENDPASPCESYRTLLGDYKAQRSNANGFTARERAAIDLRVPDSGNPWLDEMIAKSRRLDMLTELTAAAIASSLYEGELSTATNLADVATRGLMANVLDEPRIEPVSVYTDKTGMPTGADMAAALDQAQRDAQPEPYVPQVGDVVVASAMAGYAGLEPGARYRVIHVELDGWLRVVAEGSKEDDIGSWIDGEDVERCNV